jgi:hypothetical protein
LELSRNEANALQIRVLLVNDLRNSMKSELLWVSLTRGTIRPLMRFNPAEADHPMLHVFRIASYESWPLNTS